MPTPSITAAEAYAPKTRTTLEHAIAQARAAGRHVPEWTRNADTIWDVVGRSPIVCHPINSPRAIGNARLVAAAPSLAFALEELQRNPNDPRAHRIALDALALTHPHGA